MRFVSYSFVNGILKSEKKSKYNIRRKEGMDVDTMMHSVFIDPLFTIQVYKIT